MDLIIVITLCAVGLLLILAEIFLIPGTSLAMMAGIAAAIGGIIYAFAYLGVWAGIITLLIMSVVVVCATIYLVKSKALDGIGLVSDIDSTVAGKETLPVTVGDEGVAVSRLNVVGKVKIGAITMEGKSVDDFIDEGSPVVVVAVSPTQLLVKLKK